MILPPPNDQDLNIYDKIDGLKSTDSEVDIQTVKITEANYLTDKKYLTMYTKLFEYFA